MHFRNAGTWCRRLRRPNVTRGAVALALLLVSRSAHAQTTAAPGRAAWKAAGVAKALAVHRRATLSEVRYALTLDVTGRDTAYGQVQIDVRTRARGDLVLDFRGLGVDTLRVNDAVVPVDSTVWNGAHLTVSARSLTVGTNRLAIAFRAPIAAAGASIIRARDVTDGADYLYTLLVPSDANLLFPCFDQPDLKARVTLTLRTPHGWSALGNGPLVRRDSTARSIRHEFGQTAPLSTYLIAFAAGPWRVASRAVAITTGAPDVPVSVWSRRSRAAEVETDSLIAMNARALRWLGDWFGIPYAFGKFDFLLAPAFPFGGMEHPGAVFYNEESFIYRERPTTTQLLGRQATVYHEIAHQWFGDYLTMRWFDDLWLKEGFATYMAAKMQASLDPASNAWKTFYLRNKPVAYGTDATAGTTPVWQALANLDQAKSNYGPIVYNKAPGILRQLNFLVGDRAFQTGVQTFLRAHAYGNATWQDLLRHIGVASGRDLTSWGRAWILRPGMPLVQQSLEVRNGRIARLTLSQRPAQPTISGTRAWPIKLQVLLAYADGRMERLPVELSTVTTEVVAARGKPAPDFVFANDGDFGYALVLPDARTVAWLDGHIGTVRDDLLRAMLWGALWDLVRESQLPPERFVALALRALSQEPDEQIVGTLIGRMSTAISRYVSDDAREAMVRDAAPLLMALAADSSRAYGPRKNALDAFVGLSRGPASLAMLDRFLDGDSVAGLALRPPTRWAIVTRLIAQRAPTAAARLAAEQRRDSTSEGRRLAFVASAATPDTAHKRELFARWFSDGELNEEWVTSSLRAFHDTDQSALTRPFLELALDTLPWIQKNRRIFFLGSWLGATLGGQQSAEALSSIDGWLRAHPQLSLDLRQKILQARDELERTVAIRTGHGKRALQ